MAIAKALDSEAAYFGASSALLRVLQEAETCRRASPSYLTGLGRRAVVGSWSRSRSDCLEVRRRSSEDVVLWELAIYYLGALPDVSFRFGLRRYYMGDIVDCL